MMAEHSLPPCAHRLGDAFFEVGTGVGGNGYKRDIGLGVKSGSTNKWCELVSNLLESTLLPVHCGVIHLVDNNYNLVYASSLDQHDMLPGLPTLLESSFELALTCTNDEDGHICLRSATDHRRHERLVSWRVKDSVPPIIRLEVGSSDLDSLTLSFSNHVFI